MTRVECLLAQRLEELALALEHTRAPARIGPLLEDASAATIDAIALGVLNADRARTIWSDARERHPVLEHAWARLPGRIAA